MKHPANALNVWIVGALLGGCDTFGAPPERGVRPSPSSTSPVPLPSAGVNIPCDAKIDNDRDGRPRRNLCGPTNVGDPALLDCDDEDPTRGQIQVMYPDADGDGFGSPFNPAVRWVCAGETVVGFAPNNTDCDDSLNSGHEFVWRDEDGDGFGVYPSVCGVAGSGWALASGDCRDDDASIRPDNRAEVAFDGVDVDCDRRDAPVFELNSVVTWEQPLCTGGVLGIIGFDPRGAFIFVANIGTTPVTDATLVVRTLGPNDVILETHTYLLPPLSPGEVTREGRFEDGNYQARFEYDGDSLMGSDVMERLDETAGDGGESTVPTVSEQRDAGEAIEARDGGAAATPSGRSDAVANDAKGDSGPSPELDGERCERAKLPLLFGAADVRRVF